MAHKAKIIYYLGILGKVPELEHTNGTPVKHPGINRCEFRKQNSVQPEPYQVLLT